MSRPRFLADNDLNEHIVTGFARRCPGGEFLRVRDLGMATTADAAILDYANRNNWLVVSHDVNTMPAAARERIGTERPMSGLLMVAQDTPVARVIASLELIWSASQAEEWTGQIVFLPF